jgi:4,5-dihydroxyphthalate decarboxylase
VAVQDLTAAFWDYDRTRPLADGRVGIPCHDLRVVFSAPEATFARSFSAEFDISELSFSNSVTRLSQGRLPYVLIPVFLSRAFRHSTIFVRTDRGIVEPADLRGKTIGVQEYDMTAAVVVRGFLRDQFGVQPEEIFWKIGESGGGVLPTFLSTPAAGLCMEAFEAGASLEERLIAGELDAIIALRPTTLLASQSCVKRLFQDPRIVEEEWFRARGIFPIMHIVGIRRELVEDEPTLAVDVYRAFVAAKQLAVEEMETLQAPKVTLPWPHFAVRDARDLMGEDYWPYGVSANRIALEAQLQWIWLDGLQARRITLEDLFPPVFREIP